MWDALVADGYFAAMFKLDFVAGRNFSHAIQPDTSGLILNESAVRELNMTPDEAIGQQIKVNNESYTYGTVIGVVKDFPYKSVRPEDRPFVTFWLLSERGDDQC
ncbi:MAG: ABC transporter permease [Bacteroidota bacterium]